MQRQVGLVAFAMCAVLMFSTACTSGGAAPNLSTVSASGSSLVVTTSATPTLTPKPTSPYPADVPLTGHNVKPGEKPPLYPDAAKVKSQAGANAFAEFFMRTWDWAYATTNPSYMKHYSGETCGLCSGISTGITKTSNENHWYLGGRLAVHQATTDPIGQVSAPADYCSAVAVDGTAQTVVDKTNKIFNGEISHTNVHFKLCERWSAATWLVSYWAKTA